MRCCLLEKPGFKHLFLVINKNPPLQIKCAPIALAYPDHDTGPPAGKSVLPYHKYLLRKSVRNVRRSLMNPPSLTMPQIQMPIKIMIHGDVLAWLTFLHFMGHRKAT